MFRKWLLLRQFKTGRVTEKMKINYTDKISYNPFLESKNVVYSFSIEKSVLKTHFKALAKMSMLFKIDYRTGKYGGYIEAKNKDAFIELVARIEKVNDKTARKSHEKTKQKSLTFFAI